MFARQKEELENVQRRLKDFSPVEVIWNAEDLTKVTALGGGISAKIFLTFPIILLLAAVMI